MGRHRLNEIVFHQKAPIHSVCGGGSCGSRNWGIAALTMIKGQTRTSFEVHGVLYARAYGDTDNTVFMKVNDIDVTYPEYAEMRMRFVTNMANNRAQVNRAIPDGVWTVPESTAENNPVRPLPELMITNSLKRMVEVMEKHGPDAGAVGALILEYAQYSTAVVEGFELSDEEVAAEVAEIREIYEANVGNSQVGMIGEEAFLDTIYSRKLRMMFATGDGRIDALSSHGGIGNISDKEMNKIEAALDLEVLNNANVYAMSQSL